MFIRPKLDTPKAAGIMNSLIESVPDIEALLQKIGQESPTQILRKYVREFNLTEEFFRTPKNNESDTQIAIFSEFLKKINASYRALKKRVREMLQI